MMSFMQCFVRNTLLTTFKPLRATISHFIVIRLYGIMLMRMIIFRSESVASADHSECSTLTGSVRTPHLSTTRLSWSIRSTRLFVDTPILSGSAIRSTNIAKCVGWPPLARSLEDWAKVITQLSSDHEGCSKNGFFSTLGHRFSKTIGGSVHKSWLRRNTQSMRRKR